MKWFIFFLQIYSVCLCFLGMIVTKCAKKCQNRRLFNNFLDWIMWFFGMLLLFHYWIITDIKFNHFYCHKSINIF